MEGGTRCLVVRHEIVAGSISHLEMASRIPATPTRDFDQPMSMSARNKKLLGSGFDRWIAKTFYEVMKSTTVCGYGVSFSQKGCGWHVDRREAFFERGLGPKRLFPLPCDEGRKPSGRRRQEKSFQSASDKKSLIPTIQGLVCEKFHKVAFP